MASLSVHTFFPHVGEIPAAGCNQKYEYNGYPSFPSYDDLPILDDNFDLFDFVCDDNQNLIKKHGSPDVFPFEMAMDSAEYATEFLENLQQEGCENLYSSPLNGEGWVEPFVKNSNLLDQLSIGEYSSEAFTIENFLEELENQNRDCLSVSNSPRDSNRSCVSPVSLFSNGNRSCVSPSNSIGVYSSEDFIENILEDIENQNRACLSPADSNRSCISPVSIFSDGSQNCVSPSNSLSDISQICSPSSSFCPSPSNSSSDGIYDSDSSYTIENSTHQKGLIPTSVLNINLSPSYDFTNNDLKIQNTPTNKKSSGPVKSKALVDKKARKKQQNRESALRYREKKRHEHSAIDIELKALEEHNADLLAKVASTKSEIAYLKSFLQDIICENQ